MLNTLNLTFERGATEMQMRNYGETLEYILNRPRTGEREDLHYMQKLLAAIGNPEKSLQFVHVAGTNGKGSATVMTASVLKEAGYKVGCNISPYVLNFRERFMINGEMISEERLAEVAAPVLVASEELDETEPRPASTFELTTAIAFLWFAEEECQIVCVEVGLGGLKDITNAIQNTLVAYIMAIDYDHTERLGTTLGEIAAQKCGIFKNNCTVVSYPGQAPAAADVITRMAAAANCRLVVPEAEYLQTVRRGPFLYRMNYGGYELTQPFAGVHQARNAAVVIEGCLALCEKGFDIDDDAIIAGIEKATLPARIEVLKKEPLVVLDGGHNAGGIAALAKTLAAEKVQGITAVVGIMGDKQAKEMLRQIAPFVGKLILVQPQNKRAIPPENLAEFGEGLYKHITLCPKVEDGIAAAKKEGKGILVCGSLYLASEARGLLL